MVTARLTLQPILKTAERFGLLIPISVGLQNRSHSTGRALKCSPLRPDRAARAASGCTTEQFLCLGGELVSAPGNALELETVTETEEYLDILDESGAVIGRELRSRCHENPELRHRAVHVFVRNSRGEIFLQKRAITKLIQPGKWDTSVGGHLQVGESYEAAAARELLEELGLRLQDLGGFSALSKRHEYVWRSSVETEHICTYEINWDGPFQLQEAEIEEGRFWSETKLLRSLGRGLLTPNLEEELRLLGICNSGLGPRD